MTRIDAKMIDLLHVVDELAREIISPWVLLLSDLRLRYCCQPGYLRICLLLCNLPESHVQYEDDLLPFLIALPCTEHSALCVIEVSFLSGCFSLKYQIEAVLLRFRMIRSCSEILNTPSRQLTEGLSAEHVWEILKFNSKMDFLGKLVCKIYSCLT